MRAAAAFVFVFLLAQDADGFSASRMTAQRKETALEADASGRRAFLDASFVTAASSILATSPAWAEDDGSVGDLSMPSEDEQKKAVSISRFDHANRISVSPLFDSFAKR